MPARGDRDPKVAARRDRVLRLYAAGATLSSIATQVRREHELTNFYSTAAVAMDLRRALEDAGARQNDLAGVLLPLELHRLDSYLRTVEVLMVEARQAGDRWLALRAMDRALRIGERRDMLLGLSRVTQEAIRGGEEPPAAVSEEREQAEHDGLDEVSRRRAARRIGYAG